MFFMNGDSLAASFESASGLLFGLFCFYVLCFGVSWFFGSKKRVELRRLAVEK